VIIILSELVECVLQSEDVSVQIFSPRGRGPPPPPPSPPLGFIEDGKMKRARVDSSHAEQRAEARSEAATSSLMGSVASSWIRTTAILVPRPAKVDLMKQIAVHAAFHCHTCFPLPQYLTV
jgi:hypothetical protein